MAKLKFGSPAWRRKYGLDRGRRRKGSRSLATRRKRRRATGASAIARNAANGSLVAALADLGAAPQTRRRASNNNLGVSGGAVNDDQEIAVMPITEAATATGGAISRVQRLSGGRFSGLTKRFLTI